MIKRLENGCEHRLLYNNLRETRLGLIASCCICDEDSFVIPRVNYRFYNGMWNKINPIKPRDKEKFYDRRLSIAS